MNARSPLVQFIFIICLMSTALAYADEPVPSFRQLEISDWDVLNQSPGIVTSGAQAVSIQIVFDPDCPASARLFDYIQRRHPNTPMRWVPIAHFGETSLGRSAAILSAAEPSQALSDNFTGYDYGRQKGAIEPIAPSSAVRRALLPAKAKVAQWIGGTPVIVVRTPGGEVLMNQLGNRAIFINALIERADGLKDFRP